MADIGQNLKAAREARGLTIENIEEKTKIQRRYLTAIENGEFEKLPGDFYVRAFIKQYAEVVGLNGNELLNDFHATVPTPQPDEYVENSNENKVERVKRTTNNKKGLWKNYIPQAIIVVGVVVVIGIIYLVYTSFFAQPNKSTSPKPDNIIVNSKVESSSKKSSKSAKDEKSSSKSSKTGDLKVTSEGQYIYTVTNVPTDGTEVEISSDTDAVWTAVNLDGTMSWQGTINGGEKQTVKIPATTKAVLINLGNTVSVKIKIGDQTLKLDDTDSNSPQNLTLNLSTGATDEASQSSSQSSSEGE